MRRQFVCREDIATVLRSPDDKLDSSVDIALTYTVVSSYHMFIPIIAHGS